MLDKLFDHSSLEQSLYQGWEREGAFAAGQARASATPFTIMIPPARPHLHAAGCADPLAAHAR
jgi:valyl-tRNA synthetase